MKKRVLITGANGFIGSHLCEYFDRRGWKVFGVCRKTSDLHFLEGINVTRITGDLLDPGEIEFPENLDVLIHNAAVADDNASARECREGIFTLTRRLVEAVKSLRIRRFVYISSGLTLGYCREDISEDHPGKCTRSLPYARFKKETEDYLMALHQEEGFPVVILRPGDVYGPRDRTSCLAMLDGLTGGVPMIVGDGKTRFAYCYVGNLAQAAFLAATGKDLNGKAFTVTNGGGLTWGEFFGGFYRELGKRQRVRVPGSMMYLIARVNQLIAGLFPGYKPSVNLYRYRRTVRNTTYDIRRTIEELGYRPDTDVHEQIRKIVEWYLREKKHRVQNKAKA